MDFSEWIERGIKENYKFILIIYDFEDKSYYPVFFASEKEAENFNNNIISESKCKVVQKIDLKSITV